MQATTANMKVFEARRAELEKLSADKLKAAQARGEKLSAVAITITSAAGEGGKLFGSIGTRDIAEQITAQGIEIAKHEVRMPMGAIRQIGEYDIVLHLHNDVEVKIKVNVVAE
jgi:large subunit ribosomal protein L9